MVQAQFSSFGSLYYNQPTYTITHGFQSSSNADWVVEIAEELKTINPFANVILVDWADAVDTINYPGAVDDTIDVGFQLAGILDYLTDIGVTNPNRTELIGHSLGAHASGNAADFYRDLTGQSIERIVGLDPAGPGFEPDLFNFFQRTPASERLDASDADRVITFHTSSTLGYDDRLGDLDFYLNWNDFNQPGQLTFIGNHSYAHEVFIDLLEGRNFVQSSGPSWNYSSLYTKGFGRHDVDTDRGSLLTGTPASNLLTLETTDELLNGSSVQDYLQVNYGNDELIANSGTVNNNFETIEEFEIIPITINEGSEELIDLSTPGLIGSTNTNEKGFGSIQNLYSEDNFLNNSNYEITSIDDTVVAKGFFA